MTELFVEKESCGGRGQKEYTDAFAKFLRMATKELIGFVCQSAQYWQSEEHGADSKSDFIKARTNALFTGLRTATRTLTLLLVSKSFLAVRASWFNAHVSKAPGDIHDCYNAQFADDFEAFHCLGSSGP